MEQAIEMNRIHLETMRAYLDQGELDMARQELALARAEIQRLESQPIVDIAERRHTQMRGPKVQRYSRDGRTLLRTYNCFMECTRDPELESPVAPVIKGHIKARTVYKGYRWAELDRDLPDDTFQDVGETVDSVVVRNGLVAMLNPSQDAVVAVFCDKKAAAEDRHVSAGSISNAFKRGTRSAGHYFVMWHDCSDELKRDYLARGNSLPGPRHQQTAMQIDQLHPTTQQLVKRFSTVAEVTRSMSMSRKTLMDAIACGGRAKGFLWRTATSSSPS